MGADLYCDSDLILRVLDRLFPDPPLGCDGAHAMTFALSPWFGQQLTQVAVPISFAGAEAVDPAFAKDREQVMGGPFVDLERWRAEAPHARERSDERRGGETGVSTVRFRGSPDHNKKKKI